MISGSILPLPLRIHPHPRKVQDYDEDSDSWEWWKKLGERPAAPEKPSGSSRVTLICCLWTEELFSCGAPLQCCTVFCLWVTLSRSSHPTLHFHGIWRRIKIPWCHDVSFGKRRWDWRVPRDSAKETHQMVYQNIQKYPELIQNLSRTYPELIQKYSELIQKYSEISKVIGHLSACPGLAFWVCFGQPEAHLKEITCRGSTVLASALPLREDLDVG